MELIAFSAAQTTSQSSDASTEVNMAGWGTLLWVTVLAVVFFVLLVAAGLPDRQRQANARVADYRRIDTSTRGAGIGATS